MEEQRVRARKAREALGDLGWTGINFGQEMPETQFVGYDQKETDAEILAIVSEDEMQQEVALRGRSDNRSRSRPSCMPRWAARSPTTARSSAATACLRSTTSRKTRAASIMHYGHVVRSGRSCGSAGPCHRTPSTRSAASAIRRAHSATHLLQAALVRGARRPLSIRRAPWSSRTACASTSRISPLMTA